MDGAVSRVEVLKSPANVNLEEGSLAGGSISASGQCYSWTERMNLGKVGGFGAASRQAPD